MIKKSISCPICTSFVFEIIFEWETLPANIGILWETKGAALNCSKGTLKVAFCQKCGHIWNTVFDQNRLEYNQAYNNSLHHSAVYSEYAKKMATHLIERYQIRNKKVLEIGCGKGDFLILLCSLGDNQAVGFDNSFETRDLPTYVKERILFIEDFYSDKYSDYVGDLIVSRYVLEHIEDPLGFMRMVRKNIGKKKDTVVYFEVPDVYMIIDQLSVWDFVYEHVSYFSPNSLAFTFQETGFEVLDLTETYNKQFLKIEAIPGNGDTASKYDSHQDLVRLKGKISEFKLKLNTKYQQWIETIDKIQSEHQRTIIWGAGARGVSFLNMLQIREAIRYVVDINPNKSGKYIPGTGQKIVSPEFLVDYEPDNIIVMNPIYASEIGRQLKTLGLNPTLIHA